MRRWRLAWLALLLSTCRPPVPPASLPADVEGWNVVLLVVDSLRADHLGSYGYTRRATSPFLDRLAFEGILFEEAQSNSSFTRESVASLFTGMLPSRSGSTGWTAVPADEPPTLAEYLRSAGYRTALISNSPVIRHRKFAQGFSVFEVTRGKWNQSGRGGELADKVLSFARETEDAPFFVYGHFLDPHGPYAPSRERYLQFADEVFPEPVSLYGQLRPNLASYLASGFGPGDPRYEDLVVRYDAEIATVDEHVRSIVEGLRESGLADSTLLVITSDHGEEFLEHGFVEHAWTLNRESVHVPLILSAPGLNPGRVETPVSLVDLAPSLLGLLGIEGATAEMDGRSWFRKERDRFVVQPRDRPRIAELLIDDRSHLRSIHRGDWKLITAARWLPSDQRPGEGNAADRASPPDWDHPVHRELYQTNVDRDEEHDLEDVRTEELLELEALLNRYRVSTLGRDPVEADELTAEEREILESLGYL